MNKMNEININEIFERLTVKRYLGRIKNGRKTWECQCKCGNIVSVTECHLKSGHTKSCGCLKKDNDKKIHTKHGLRYTRLYSIWSNIKYRCECKTCSDYQHYGERGINLCDSWKSFEPFYHWAIVSGYQDKLTIDRIDVNGDYSPQNCRWVDCKTQANNKRNNHWINYNNQTHTIAEWSEIINIPYQTLYSRIVTMKWDVEKALTTYRYNIPLNE